MPHIDMTCLLLQVAGAGASGDSSKETILLIYIKYSVILLDTIQFTNVQYVTYDDVNGSNKNICSFTKFDRVNIPNYGAPHFTYLYSLSTLSEARYKDKSHIQKLMKLSGVNVTDT